VKTETRPAVSRLTQILQRETGIARREEVHVQEEDVA